MKHTGSSEDRSARATTSDQTSGTSLPSLQDPGSQSLTSKLIVLVAGLFLVAVTLDAPVRALAQSLDPSVRNLLWGLTRFGNAGWPLGIGLGLLGLASLLRRSDTPPPAKDLDALRAMLIFMLTSVAVSGVLASLTKNVIG
ncbi:MAG: hypothetical protein ACK4GC_03670, partial [Paracoccaceae bacterium]